MKALLASTLALGITAVYQPNSIIPKYYVDKNPQGEYRVYDSRQIVVPKYIVKQDPAGAVTKKRTGSSIGNEG